MTIRSLFFLIILCYGCSKITPRKPVNPKQSTSLFKETILASKALNKTEEDKILSLIRTDSTKTYFTLKSSDFANTLYKTESSEIVKNSLQYQ